MKNSLNNYKILGLPTNITFLKRVLEVSEFEKGLYDTNFIKKNEEFLLHK